MRSFRTELEDPVVEQDILDLEKKIALFHEGKIDDEKFRSLRLARGVYGQRQPGVQMIRIKIPFGKLTVRQLRRICEVSDEYSTGNLHITTRQDIQIHYVSLDRTPELWAELERDQITLREACGNTVRNITASASAGVDPKEAFDVSPYAYELFEYFLRNPICQEMGRKFKIAFSANEEDSALSLIHDLGVIPKVKVIDGKEVRGFKVLIGGGLGAQPSLAEVAYEFLEEDQLIPFSEALVRVFDRYGERNRRTKARLKFLMQDLGKEGLLKLIEEEWPSVANKSKLIDRNAGKAADVVFSEQYGKYQAIAEEVVDQKKFELWKETNVFQQKQEGYVGVYLRIQLGNMTTATARKLAEIVERFAADDLRLTINQGGMLRYVKEDSLPRLFNALDTLGFANPGFDSIADITACPGTDTCNLGISSSTGIAKALEDVIATEYPELVKDTQLSIKISGCPNACGQHSIASIGFHGSSQKNRANKMVFPALQVLLGGGIDGDGAGRVADKVIKVPSKRGLDVLRYVLDDYDTNANEGEYFVDYYGRQGKEYFYELLKPLADVSTLEPADYIDWGSEGKFEVHKAVGECAGVIIDLVQTLIYETEEKMEWAEQALAAEKYADAIYHAYNVMVNGAKALLLSEDVKLNTQKKVIEAFDEKLVAAGAFKVAEGTFEDQVLQINKEEPNADFALRYVALAKGFLTQVQAYRSNLQEA
ncbi:nitrite reductase [Algivirga pacifica]|uniref:Sulfite reductase (Ferredoxin) n=1 Tax=Algivirga pacifica TaxID=1162670 RepID=A0ABP9DKJ2_9BACT